MFLPRQSLGYVCNSWWFRWWRGSNDSAGLLLLAVLHGQNVVNERNNWGRGCCCYVLELSLPSFFKHRREKGCYWDVPADVRHRIQHPRPYHKTINYPSVQNTTAFRLVLSPLYVKEYFFKYI